MKRHQQLQPLSRQHHNGLLAALLLKKGVKKDAPVNVMQDFILQFWQNDLKQHFEDEENFLLPAIKNTPLYASAGMQLLREHKAMRELIVLFEKKEGDTEKIIQFSTLLEMHIRFEERNLFPKAEAVLSQEQLEIIGKNLHEGDKENCMNYPLKFWE